MTRTPVALLIVAGLLACDRAKETAALETELPSVKTQTTPDFPNLDRWPPLNSIKHVKGRPATENDVKSGAAAFFLQPKDGAASVPMAILIPQYAHHVDEETGEKTPVVVIQAEQADEIKALGLLSVADGSYMVATLAEVELLGSSAPTANAAPGTPSPSAP